MFESNWEYVTTMTKSMWNKLDEVLQEMAKSI
jgi:hypothetical protein